MQREHFIPIVHSLYVVNVTSLAGFAELSKNMVLLLDILVSLSTVDVSGLFYIVCLSVVSCIYNSV